MITIEKKLDVFTKLVLEKAQHQLEEKKNEINRKNRERIEEHKVYVQKECNKIMVDKVKKGEIEKRRFIAKANVTKNKEILLKKQELVIRITENIGNRAENFVQSKSYELYFKDCMEEVLEGLKGEEDIYLYIRDMDVKNHKNFVINKGMEMGFSENAIKILPMEEDFIGGVIGMNKKKTIRMDASVGTAIKDHKNRIGQRLFERLNEVGDFHG